MLCPNENKIPFWIRRYKVYTVTPEAVEHIEYLKSLEHHQGIDFWSDLRRLNDNVDIMVPLQMQEAFEYELSSRSMKYIIMLDNVERCENVDFTQN